MRRVYLRCGLGENIVKGLVEELVDSDVKVYTLGDIQENTPETFNCHLIHMRESCLDELKELRDKSPNSFIVISSNCGRAEWQKDYAGYFDFACNVFSRINLREALERAGLAKRVGETI